MVASQSIFLLYKVAAAVAARQNASASCQIDSPERPALEIEGLAAWSESAGSAKPGVTGAVAAGVGEIVPFLGWHAYCLLLKACLQVSSFEHAGLQGELMTEPLLLFDKSAVVEGVGAATAVAFSTQWYCLLLKTCWHSWLGEQFWQPAGTGGAAGEVDVVGDVAAAVDLSTQWYLSLLKTCSHV